MKKTLILTFSPTFIDKAVLLNEYQILKHMVKESIVASNCKAKTRVCLGNFKFLKKQGVALHTSPLIHVIISGKNISPFSYRLERKVEMSEMFELTSEILLKGDAFSLSNNRLFRKLSIKDVVFKSSGRTVLKLKESKTSIYVL